MAEKTIVVDIDIKAEDIKAASSAMAEAQKQSAAYTKALNDLKTQQKEANALYKVGAIDATENAKRQSALKIQMTEVSKSLSQSNKEYANNKTVVDAATGSNEQLRARLSLLTSQYNGLSKEQRENSASGKQMQATIKTLSDKLKENEKALGDNRRNVGNYGEAIEEALGATTAFGSGLGGMVGGLKAATSASLTFLATPIGAAIGALALAVGAVTGLFSLFSKSLNRTEDGAATLSKVTGTFSAIMNGVLKVLEPLATSVMEGVANGFDKIGKAAKSASGFLEDGLRFFGLDGAADGVNNFSSAIEESVKGTRELADAQVELNKINREQAKIQLEYQNRAEKLRQIRDDEALSIEERKKANVELGQVLEEQSQKELKLANRSLEIAKKQAQINGKSTENLDAIAEAETKILEIEERITSQRSEQLTNTNSLIRDQRALLKEAATEKAKQTKEEKKLEEERLKAIEQGYIDERALIDLMAETKKNQAISNIANAEEQAETIRYIEKQALLDKIAMIDEETIAATAGAEAIGAVDEAKYQNQLAERAKYQAQIAMMDRAALAKSFTDKIAAISIDEKLELDAAELSIDNEKKLS
jgi:hypothetical protein